MTSQKKNGACLKTGPVFYGRSSREKGGALRRDSSGFVPDIEAGLGLAADIADLSGDTSFMDRCVEDMLFG